MASTQTGLTNNRTLKILSKAEEGRYGVAAVDCYDAHSAFGVVRAAERARSPAILQIFPVTLHYGGKPYLRFLLDLAHSASVPIAVHLDHATTDEDIQFALKLAEEGVAFDSIMIDASHADTDEENIAITKAHVQRATACGVAIEAELGRLEGGEAGLRVISDGQLTDPAKATHFMESTGATLLAPCIGNLHGHYIEPPNFRQDILQQLHSILRPKGQFTVLHGTDELPDSLFQECVKNGVTKFNINSWARDPYISHFGKSIEQKVPLPQIIEEGTEIFTKVCERFFQVLGSTGKA